ncbi:hypothetical protein [Neobacillus soli]|uniref:hypothetical protein n=1 Tax=Neobacillus soli TaxID=220688 RepID=UPI0008255353|nr:hypothetical protein [Neobacillus soli]
MINLTESQKSNQYLMDQLPTETLQFIAGMWINGKYLWLHDCTEKVIYEEEIIIKVKEEQPHSKIRLSTVYVSNHSKQTKEIKVLAMHHYSPVCQDNLTFVSPLDHHIFHHGNKRMFLVNAKHEGAGMKEYTAVPKWNVYTDRIWSSLQKGSLTYQPMAKGPAASVFAMKMSTAPHGTSKMSTWTITGADKNELISIEQALFKNTSISF